MNPDDLDEIMRLVMSHIGAQIPMDNEDSSQQPFPVPAVHSSPSIADELGDRLEYQDFEFFDTTFCYEMESVDEHPLLYPFPLEAVQPQQRPQVFRQAQEALEE